MEPIQLPEVSQELDTTITEQPQVETPVVETPAPEPQLYEVKVSGKTMKVPLDELLNGYSRQQDYTQKTTQIAEWRRQAEQQVQQYAAAVEQYERVLNDPRVRQYLESLEAGTASADEVPTMGQVQQQLQRQQQTIEQRIQQQVAAAQAEIEVKQLQATYDGELNQTFKGVVDKFPFLADIPGIQTQLRLAVAEREPQSIAEAKQMLTELATTHAQKVAEHFKQMQTQEAVRKAAALKNGIEPPGGAATVTAQPKMKFGSQELRDQVIRDLAAAAVKE